MAVGQARADEVGLGGWIAAAHDAHVAVALWRLHDAALVEVNQAFCRLLHLSPAAGPSGPESDAESRLSLLEFLDPPVLQGLQRRLLRQGSVCGLELSGRNRLGEPCQLAVSATLVPRDGVAHALVFLSDLTSGRELVDGLQAAQWRLGVALRASGLLVFRQDQALRYTWVANPALGVTESDVLGRTDEELLGAEVAAPLVAVKRRVLQTGQAERRDVWVANNGQLGCFDLMVEPERDATGQVVAVLCAAMDITQRMTAQGPPPMAGGRVAASRLQTIDGMASLLGHEGLSPRQVQRLARIRQAAGDLAGPAQAVPVLPLQRLRAAHAGRLVLVCEHSPVLRELVVALLQAADLQVLEAHNGVQAFSLAVQHNPALLLLDMELPQRGGVAAARAVRAMATGPLPIIAMVSVPPHPDAALVLDADLQDVIDKPASAGTLYPKVLSWLETP